MTQFRPILYRLRSNIDFLVVAITAIYLRTYRPGIWNVNWDELNVLFWAQRIARHGEFIWVSNNWIGWGVSWNPIGRHSAVSNYTAAIPYLFTDSAIGVRFFTGLLGGLSVIVIYWLVRRFIGRRAALITGLMFAVSIASNEAARRVINANLALFFIALWAFTGLYGYYANTRWGKLTHWVCLSLITQYHPTSALLIAPSMLLLVGSWLHDADNRAHLYRWTVAGFALAVLVTLPWIAGNLFVDLTGSGLMWSPNVEIAGQTAAVEAEAGQSIGFYVQSAVKRFSRLTVATEYRGLERIDPDTTTIYPPWWTDGILYGYSMLGVLGAFALLIYGIRRFWQRLPMTFFALVVVFPITIAYILVPDNITDPYFYSIAYGFFPVTGIYLAALSRWNAVGRYLSIVLTGLYVVMQLWLTAGTYRWIADYGWYQPLMAPMEVYDDLADEWVQQTGDVAIVVDTRDIKFAEWDAQRYFWSIMGGGDEQIRIINRNNGQGIPISPQGTMIVGLSDGGTIPRVTNDITLVGNSWYQERPIFQQTTLSPDTIPELDFTAGEISRFSTGVQMVGAYLESDLAAGEVAYMSLVWRPEQDTPPDEYQFSVRLVDMDGNTYGQRDFRSLDRVHWHDGDVVVNPTEIAVNDNYRPETELQVQVIMYRFEDTQALDAVDDADNVVAPWLYLFSS